MQTVGPDKTMLWPRKLKDLSWEKLGVGIQPYGEPHSPIEDAKAALGLYKSVRDDWECIVRKKAAKTNEIRADEAMRERHLMVQKLQYEEWVAAAYHHVQHQLTDINLCAQYNLITNQHFESIEQ